MPTKVAVGVPYERQQAIPRTSTGEDGTHALRERRAALALCLALSLLSGLRRLVVGCDGSARRVDNPPPEQPSRRRATATPPPPAPPPIPRRRRRRAHRFPIRLPIGAGARVLFIGNSLTEVNDLPGIGPDASPRRPASTGSSRPRRSSGGAPGGSLERGAAGPAHPERELGRRGVAAGPIRAAGEPGEPAAMDAREFNEVVREAGGRSALYMVWPMTEPLLRLRPGARFLRARGAGRRRLLPAGRGELACGVARSAGASPLRPRRVPSRPLPGATPRRSPSSRRLSGQSRSACPRRPGWTP